MYLYLTISIQQSVTYLIIIFDTLIVICIYIYGMEYFIHYILNLRNELFEGDKEIDFLISLNFIKNLIKK